MENFSLLFIFAESSKEIIIEGDGDVFDMAKFDLIATFAENIDFICHTIKFCPYKRNSDDLRERLVLLSDKYKAVLPKIQQLPAFFKNQPDMEWFFIGFNHIPNQGELIKIGASLEHLNNGKSYQKLLDEIDGRFSGVTGKYEICTFYGNTRKKFYGERDKSKRICRYCHRTIADGARFSQEAHAISDTLGNKVLYSYDECDECNDYLGSHCEQDFSEFLRFERCFWGIKSRGGITEIKGKNFTMKHEEGKSVDIKYFLDSDEVNVTPSDIVCQYESVYNPQNIYRALVKYFLGLLPQKYVSHFEKTGSWVRNKDTDGNPVSLPNLPVIKRLRTDRLVAHPQLVMYIRKDNDKSLPYAVGEFHIFNYIYAYIIPGSDGDDNDFCTKDDFLRFWNYFKHYKVIPHWDSYIFDKDEKRVVPLNIKISSLPTSKA